MQHLLAIKRITKNSEAASVAYNNLTPGTMDDTWSLILASTFTMFSFFVLIAK